MAMRASPLVLALTLAAIAPLPAGADSSGSYSHSEFSSSAVPTKNYIDTIAGYSDLSTCAENVLSTIVRAQSSGCGDNGALTSYTCFCTDSSSLFSSEITSAISVSCSLSIWSAQASSAIDVFDSYCALGVEAGLAKTTSASPASSTGVAAPAATVSNTAASATATSSAEAAKDSSSSTAILAVAVAVPLSVTGLALMWCFLWRRRRKILQDDEEERQRRVETLPQRTATGRATVEFKWPARVADVSSRLTERQQAQEKAEKEVFVNSPTASSFATLNTIPAPTHYTRNADYHNSPQEYACRNCQHHQRQQHHADNLEEKIKYFGHGMYYQHQQQQNKQQQQQQLPAELPNEELSEYSHRRPQELPAQSTSPVYPHELEASSSPEMSATQVNRSSYQS